MDRAEAGPLQRVISGKFDERLRWNEEFMRVLLRSPDGQRMIWTRMMARGNRPDWGMVALTADMTNIMTVRTTFRAGGRARIDSIGIGVMVDEEGARLRPKMLKSGTVAVLTVHAADGAWGNSGWEGVINPDETFPALSAQGFYRLDADLLETLSRLDAAATVRAFLTQLDGYLKHPETFAPEATPSIRPQLIVREAFV